MKYAVNTNGLLLGVDVIEWGLSGLDGGKEEIAEMATRTADAGLEVVGYINGGKIFKADAMKQ